MVGLAATAVALTSESPGSRVNRPPENQDSLRMRPDRSPKTSILIQALGPKFESDSSLAGTCYLSKPRRAPGISTINSDTLAPKATGGDYLFARRQKARVMSPHSSAARVEFTKHRPIGR